MANCIVRDWQGKEAGKASLDLKVAKEAGALDLMHRAVLRQQAHSRQGTASTLTRSEVRGGGRKPYKQKGTGRARQGSIRTPLRPGGGITFGPKPRSYNLAMNRKERRSALRTALMARIEDLVVVKDFATTLTTPKTKEIIDAIFTEMAIEVFARFGEMTFRWFVDQLFANLAKTDLYGLIAVSF